MGLHDPFRHLKHKLWPKEMPRVKLAIWLPTTKSWESTRFPYVQVVCDLLLKSSRRGLQLCYRPHPNQRSTHKVIAPQSHGSPNFGNFKTPIWQSRDKKAIWMWALWRGVEYTIRGKVMASPKFGPWWVLWVWVRPWLVLGSKMFSQSTNQFIAWFCASSCEWVKACHSS
jgi:hypothetical protein